MKKPSKKWLAVAAAGCVFASSMGTLTYKALAGEFVYSDANVSLTSIIDRYIEENGEVFTPVDTQEDTTEVSEGVIAEATTTDAAVVTGDIQPAEVVSGKITEIAQTTEQATTEEVVAQETTEASLDETSQTVASDVAASPVVDFSGKAIVTASGSVNIRQSGDVSAQKVGTIDANGIMTVVEKGDTWSHITSGNVDGYIKNEFIAFGDDAANYAAANLSKVAVVNTASLKLRSAASTDSESITLLAQGESYAILETGEAWTKIQLDTVAGYVKNEYIMISYNMPTAKAVQAEQAPAPEAPTTEAPTTDAPTTEAPVTEAPSTEAPTADVPASPLGQQIADFACQFVGNPYVWGGTSLTNGADCSGFVQSVYKNFGYSLPRTCTPQSKAGTPVSLAALQPGDLVFYDHGTGSCEHVAIYIGNGQVVHASSSRTGIKISNVNYSTPFKACRILN